ncbi:MAG: DUF4365 domain-containing protein [Bacteroidetes bacterium]|nr:DUF4365 domain-containing protein [Bacteroidota bacterium]
MAKTVSESHITGDKGVAAFHTYCVKHTPYIIWRPETVNDFGIDGEVELTSKNTQGKLEATGEILKIQIKSTLKGSYIHKETAEAFEFTPREDDIEYWTKHKLDVVLVIFNDATDELFAKKITKLDEGYFKKNIPITISKTDNILSIGDNRFLEKYSQNFKQRINYNFKETLSTNIFRFSKLPKNILEFDAKILTAKEIFEQLPRNERPIFLIRTKKIYSFSNPSIFPKFKDIAIDYSSRKELLVKNLLKQPENSRLVAELMNLEFKEFCYSEYIAFNKQYGRYFFVLKSKTFTSRIEYYDSKAKKKDTHRTVVSFHEYKPTNFFRHFAFETKFLYDETGLFLVINPQYFFTSDGMMPLEDKAQITKLTNYLTSKERNQHVLNHVHFVFSFLAKGRPKMTLSVLEGSEIELASYETFSVGFGIPLDNRHFGKTETHYDKSSQQEMF